jgi:tight adherence protein B
MNILLFGVVIFIFSLLVIELSFYAARIILHPDRMTVRRRLRQSLAEEDKNAGGDIFKRNVFSDVPFINRMLAFLPGVERMHLAIKQANVPYTLAFLIFLTLTLGLAGYLFCLFLTRNPALSLLVALSLASLPVLYVRSKKKQRMGKFEKQLPEALGLIARALRAGHAFTSGMKITSEEIGDPLGPEFEDTLDEINFGVSVADALKNLAGRVDCPDLKFFVVSVILQRETGGNLAEIIEGLAHLIRERFKFRGKVRVLSAEGRLSGAVLVILPFLLFGVLYIVNQEFINPLILDPLGRIFVGVGGFMMLMGVIVIRKIIKVDV